LQAAAQRFKGGIASSLKFLFIHGENRVPRSRSAGKEADGRRMCSGQWSNNLRLVNYCAVACPLLLTRQKAPFKLESLPNSPSDLPLSILQRVADPWSHPISPGIRKEPGSREQGKAELCSRLI
jgi:hypothetical protein